jgi:hypothetical protein
VGNKTTPVTNEQDLSVSWYSLSPEEVLNRLETTPANGLTKLKK